MLEATADAEKAFQSANTVLVSSTVSSAAIPRRALRANALAPDRHPSTQLVPRHGDYDWLILSQSRMGMSSGATRIWMLRATPG